MKAREPRRSWLEPHEARAVLDCAGRHAALIGVMMIGGLRVSEALGLRWRMVDLPAGRLSVESGKTDHAARTIELSPALREALTLHRANSERTAPDDVVFASVTGSVRNRGNVSRRIIEPTIERASARLVEQGHRPIAHTSAHDLRRTACALMFASGATPPEVMQAMGHSDPALALAIYAKVVKRAHDSGSRLDALLGGDWAAAKGTSGDLVSFPAASGSLDLA